MAIIETKFNVLDEVVFNESMKSLVPRIYRGQIIATHVNIDESNDKSITYDVKYRDDDEDVIKTATVNENDLRTDPFLN